ncbi:MAG: molybdopterin-binding protein, partial [Finegoldia magna]
MYKVAVLTVSDKGSQGKREDLSGKKIIEIIEKNGYKLEKYDIVADEKELIKEKLIEYSNENIELILTTGGTGFSK